MATFRNACGCTISGDIESADEINKDRMGDGWDKVEEEQNGA